MQESKHCCEKFKKANQGDNFITSLRMEGTKTTYYIRGKSNLINDGDGYFDNMTDEIQISFCPFCGKKIF